MSIKLLTCDPLFRFEEKMPILWQKKIKGQWVVFQLANKHIHDTFYRLGGGLSLLHFTSLIEVLSHPFLPEFFFPRVSESMRMRTFKFV